MRHQFRCLYVKQSCFHLYSVLALSAVTSIPAVTSVPAVTPVTAVTVVTAELRTLSASPGQLTTCKTILIAVLQRSCCGPTAMLPTLFIPRQLCSTIWLQESPAARILVYTRTHQSDFQGRAAPPTELGQGDPRKTKAVSPCLSGGGSSFL